MPAAKGNYLLQISIGSAKEIQIGSSRTILFPSGYYLYIGSAFGGGGLEARLTRHLRHEKRMHWHIDYLLEASEVISAWQCEVPYSVEHEIANYFSQSKQFSIAAPRFGSGDCKCSTHLFYAKQLLTLVSVNKMVRHILPPGKMFTVYK